MTTPGHRSYPGIRYSVLTFVAASVASILMIPLLPLTVPIAWYYYRRYYASLEVVLTSRELQVSRGALPPVARPRRRRTQGAGRPWS